MSVAIVVGTNVNHASEDSASGACFDVPWHWCRGGLDEGTGGLNICPVNMVFTGLRTTKSQRYQKRRYPSNVICLSLFLFPFVPDNIDNTI